MREHHYYREKTSNKKKEDIAIGNVVLIYHNTPRNQMEEGVVTNLHTGKDGLVRYVRVRCGKELSSPLETL